VLELENSTKPISFPILLLLKKLIFEKNVLIFIFKVYSVYPLLIPHNMFSSGMLNDECPS